MSGQRNSGSVETARLLAIITVDGVLNAIALAAVESAIMTQELLVDDPTTKRGKKEAVREVARAVAQNAVQLMGHHAPATTKKGMEELTKRVLKCVDEVFEGAWRTHE